MSLASFSNQLGQNLSIAVFATHLHPAGIAENLMPVVKCRNRFTTSVSSEAEPLTNNRKKRFHRSIANDWATKMPEFIIP